MTKNIALMLVSLFAVVGAVVFYAAPTGQAAPVGSDIQRERLTINVTGTGASATTRKIINGRIVRVDLDYAAGLTTTTDVTLSGANDLVTNNVVNLTNTATDTSIYPSVQLTDNAGAGRTFDGTYPVVAPYPVNDLLTAVITQTGAATPAVVIDIYYQE